MKISNSKKELARIISENGGWRDGAKWAAMDKTDGHCNSNSIGFFRGKYRPECYGTIKMWRCRYIETEFMGCEKSIICEKIIGNWHQSCLSSEEYFHLHPAPDADGWIQWNGEPKSPVDKGTFVDVKMKYGACHEAQILDDENWGHFWGDGDIIAYRLHKPEQQLAYLCDKVTEENKHGHVDAKPTIEQLAADYRNRKDYADRKQQEADAAKADAEAKLAELVSAGKALNLVISVVEEEQEMVITDWRDLRVDDEIEYIDGTSPHWAGRVGVVELIDEDGEYHILFRHGGKGDSDDPTNWMSTRWCSEFRFIRRP